MKKEDEIYREKEDWNRAQNIKFIHREENIVPWDTARFIYNP